MGAIPKTYNQHILGTKWIFKNKANDSGVVVSNKTRLETQG